MPPRHFSWELPRLAVIGTGYLGAVHAACMANIGFDVIGVDIDSSKVNALNTGRPPFFEPEFEDVLEQALDSGRLTFTSNIHRAAEFGDVHFLCVGTPQESGSNRADLSFLRTAVESLVPLLGREALLVGKSTVPVGTASQLADKVARLAPPNTKVELAWNPEFLREGFAVDDTLNPDRLVVGVSSEAAEHCLRVVYATQICDGVPFLSMDLATAELVKVAANSFLATKISFINAMAEVCEVTGADVTLLAEAIGMDDRIGPRFLRAGLGFGGGCLPKDIRAFMARASELGVQEAVGFLREVDDINTRRRNHVVEVAVQAMGGQASGQSVAVLGAAFKPNSDDTRDSPALDVALMLQSEGADVRVYDPKAARNAARSFPTLEYAASAESACRGARCVLLLTEWEEFVELDPQELSKIVGQPIMIDARNALDPNRWRSAGWTYWSIGRP